MKYLSSSFVLVGLLVLVLSTLNSTALAQTVSIADHVVINEVDIDPPGDDSKLPLQWVELYNPTDSPVNIGGWSIGATSGLKNTFTIASGTVIQSQQFLVYTYGPLWFPHAGAVVQLKTLDGKIIDQTPSLTDQQDDSNTWQRIFDGYNATGTQNDWIFKKGTLGTSNGKLSTTTTTNQLEMTLSTDKPSYVFAESVQISGKVSQMSTTAGLSYIPQHVDVTVSGPNGFKKTFTLFPDANLQFSTSMKLDPILGMSEGSYNISASYGGATASSSFIVSSEAFVAPPAASSLTISVSTDKAAYALTEPIVLSGTVSQVVPFTAVSYKVYDPNKSLVYSGNVFPDTQGKFTTSNPYQQSVATSGLLVNSVNPIYGMYQVVVTYNKVTASTSFILVQSESQTSSITVTTDKTVYAPGDVVTIYGRSGAQGLQNVGLSPTLQIVQTFTPTVSSQCGYQCGGVGVNTANIQTFVNLETDNTYSYKFQLSGTSSSLGNYRVTVSTSNGKAETNFVVVQNPSTYNQTTTTTAPFVISTDKTLYGLGDPLIISGYVANPTSLATQNAGLSVNILVMNSTGQPISSQGSFLNNVFVPTSTTYSYSTIPDSNGHFQMSQTLQRGIFHAGSYTLKAKYGELSASTSFTIYDTSQTGNQPIVATTDKTVYGLGETVNLTGKLTNLAQSSSYTVYLTKPDGTLIQSPLSIQNGQFAWSYAIPSSVSASELPKNCAELRCVPKLGGTFGIYKLSVVSGNIPFDLYFEVSANPQSDVFTPFLLQTDKTQYQVPALLQLSGQVIPPSDHATQETNPMPSVIIYSSKGQEVYRTFVNVNSGGQFQTAIQLKPGIFKTDQYKLYGQYLDKKATATFKVTDPFNTTSTKLSLLLTTDRQNYLPGDTVLLTGRTSYIISVENVDLAVGQTGDIVVNEGEVVSKKGVTLPRATAQFDETGSFSYDYKIPTTASLGNYTITAQVPFGVFNTYFNVVSKLPEQSIPSSNVTMTTPSNVTTPSNATVTPTTIIPEKVGPTQKRSTGSMLIERNGRISDSTIAISLQQKSSDNKTFYPREFDGLLRLNPGDENKVSLKVSTINGTCIIGVGPDCKVSSSTIKTSSSYQLVSVNGKNFLIGYSGNGLRVQQFSIIPANADDVIPDGQWTVNILKNDQISRFYYQVTYVSK